MVNKKQSLGKGIEGLGVNVLIPSKKNVPTKKEENKEIELDNKDYTMINLSKIEPNREQPRKMFDEDALEELSNSIKEVGIIQPLVLQKRDKYYEIIAGERRWRAAKLAGLKEVPAIIKDYSEKEIVEIALIENIQRQDLNPIEEAVAYQKLIKEFNLSQEEVAKRVSKGRSTISNTMRLLELDERVQQMIIEMMLSSGHVRTLITIEDKDAQYELALKMFDENLSVREAEKLVNSYKKSLEEGPKEEKKLDENVVAQYESMQETLKNNFNTKVTIKHKDNNKGKIEIEYYSIEDLERIFDMLNR